MQILRTPDDRFADLPGYAFAPHYTEITAVPGDTVWRSLTGGMKAGESVVYTAQLRCKQGDQIDVEITLSCQAINGQKVFVAVTRSQAGNHG